MYLLWALRQTLSVTVQGRRWQQCRRSFYSTLNIVDCSSSNWSGKYCVFEVQNIIVTRAKNYINKVNIPRNINRAFKAQNNYKLK